MLIEYKAYDRTGKPVNGKMEADSERVAEEILWQSDLIVTRVRRVRKPPALHTLAPTLFGVKQREVVAMMRQLATRLDSGLPLILSLEALSHEKVHPMLNEALEGIIGSINEGGRFSDGLARYPAIFPAIFVRLSRIGEQIGELSDVLRRAAFHLESQAEIKGKLRSSLTYARHRVRDGGHIHIHTPRVLDTHAIGTPRRVRRRPSLHYHGHFGGQRLRQGLPLVDHIAPHRRWNHHIHLPEEA